VPDNLLRDRGQLGDGNVASRQSARGAQQPALRRARQMQRGFAESF
jgi:hypothetical protein